MKESQLFEKIELYLKNKLSAEDRNSFEEEMASDENLTALVKQHQEEEKVMELMIEDDLRSKLKDWDNETISSDSKTSKNSKWFPFLILLSFALAAGTAFYFFNDRNVSIETQKIPEIQIEDSKTNPTPSNIEKTDSLNQESPRSKEKIIADNKESTTKKSKTDHSKPPNKSSTLLAAAETFYAPVNFSDTQERSNEIKKSDLFNQALSNLQQKNYKQGCADLKDLLNNNPSDIESQYHLGAGFYSLENFRSAIPLLKQVSESIDYIYSEQAIWMLALSYIYTNKEKEGILILEEITKDDEHSYFEEASKLLSEL